MAHTSPYARSDSHSEALPSTRSIIQVLYPPSYLGIPDPPPYPSERRPPSTNSGGTPQSRSHPDPLSEDPALTGVPSETPPRTDPLLIDCGDVLEESEPLPAYSRFDQRRPRFPVASDILGPYPSLPVLHQAAR